MGGSEGQTFLGSVVRLVAGVIQGFAILFVVIGGYFVVQDTWIWLANPNPKEVSYKQFVDSPPEGRWFTLKDCLVAGTQRVAVTVPSTSSGTHVEVFVPVRPTAYPSMTTRTFVRVSRDGDAKGDRCIPLAGDSDSGILENSLVVYVPPSFYHSKEIKAALAASSGGGAADDIQLLDATTGPVPPWRNPASWSVIQGFLILGAFGVWRRFRRAPAVREPATPAPRRDPDAIIPRQ